MKNNDLDTWEIKFKRENWSIPFGSLCNIYAQMHQQKPVPMKKFVEDITQLFRLSQEMINEAIKSTKGEPEPKIETDKIVSRKLGEEWQKKYNEMSEIQEKEVEQKEAEEKLPIIEQ